MNQQLTDQPKKSNQSKYALLCLGASIAGATYGLSNIVALFNQYDGSRAYTKAEHTAFVAPWFSNFYTVIAPILVVAIIAGILTKGGRKWTLISSWVGILISLGTIGVFAIIRIVIHFQVDPR
jgi:hypothetical protein